MDTRQILQDSLTEKINEKLNELEISLLIELISHLYIKNVLSIRRSSSTVLFIDCINLANEDTNNIKNVLASFNSSFVKIRIKPAIYNCETPKHDPNRLGVIIIIDRDMFQQTIIGNQFNRNLH